MSLEWKGITRRISSKRATMLIKNYGWEGPRYHMANHTTIKMRMKRYASSCVSYPHPIAQILLSFPFLDGSLLCVLGFTPATIWVLQRPNHLGWLCNIPHYKYKNSIRVSEGVKSAPTPQPTFSRVHSN